MSDQLGVFPSSGTTPAGEEDAQIAEWAAATGAFDDRVLVTELVRATALASPHTLAVGAEQELLTYGELDEQANRLAHHLLARGAGPDHPAVLCLPRSSSLVLSALAVLKTGAAYVPLDPGWPLERLRFVIKDSGAALVITQRSVASGITSGQCPVVDLEADAEAISRCPVSLPPAETDAQSLAYIIYTSGSTGKPKGVEITHEALLNLVHWHRQTFRITPSDRATLLASPGFDASVWEIWPYLCSGASLHIPGECLRYDAGGLRDWILSHEITITFVPTPLAELMVGLQWPPTTPLRLMLTGADTLHRYPPKGFPFQLINNYGPTECTVVTTSGVVPAGGLPGSLPSIGQPISNFQVYILDENLRQVPDGATGELYVGGKGLARGYRNLPELTAERFIANPFSAERGSRLYRTGDLGRYLSDGSIEFLGRADDQIKIRGYRIEPGEIIATLARHPSVQASYVLARDVGRVEKELTAYIVAAEDSEPAAEELRSFLLRHLPEYLVPAVFVSLESLPLNSSGKVDRSALPPPNEFNLLKSLAYVAPQSDMQERVMSIVVDLLGSREIGAHDNFFMAGGDSFLAAQLIARIEEAFAVEIPLGRLFGVPTVAQLSAVIEQLLTGQPAGRKEPARLTEEKPHQTLRRVPSACLQK